MNSGLSRLVLVSCHSCVKLLLGVFLNCGGGIASFPGSPRARTAFPYFKRRKAGRGLGTRLVVGGN